MHPMNVTEAFIKFGFSINSGREKTIPVSINAVSFDPDNGNRFEIAPSNETIVFSETGFNAALPIASATSGL